MEREDDFDIEEWSRQTRCVKCGNQLFPHNPKRAYVWAEHAYLKWNQTGLSPEHQRDTRSPNLMATLRNKNHPVVLYY